MRPVLRLAAAASLLAAWGLLAGGAAAADGGVTIAGFAFSPATITVAPGDTVTWTNSDGATHTATGSGFDTGPIAGGATASVTFSTAGTFAYQCSIHPSMRGTVVVKAAGGGTGSGSAGATAPATDAAPLATGTPADPAVPWLGLGAVAMAGGLGALLGGRRVAAARARARTVGPDRRTGGQAKR